MIIFVYGACAVSVCALPAQFRTLTIRKASLIKRRAQHGVLPCTGTIFHPAGSASRCALSARTGSFTTGRIQRYMSQNLRMMHLTCGSGSMSGVMGEDYNILIPGTIWKDIRFSHQKHRFWSYPTLHQIHPQVR